MLVLDDDAIFSCDFRQELTRVLQDTRCAPTAAAMNDTYDRTHRNVGGEEQLVDQNARYGQGSVLMLGAAIWIDGTYPRRGPYCAGWALADEDLRMATETLGLSGPRSPQCFNANSKSFGSFAVIYPRAAFEPLISLIDSTSVPFDHLFAKLAVEDEIAVRVAVPAIAGQDVRHESQIDPTRGGQTDMEVRSALHRWDVDSMCPMPQQVFADPQQGLGNKAHQKDYGVDAGEQ